MEDFLENLHEEFPTSRPRDAGKNLQIKTILTTSAKDYITWAPPVWVINPKCNEREDGVILT